MRERKFVRTFGAKFAIGNWSATARERSFLIVVAVLLSLLSHIVFLRLLPIPWQRNESADYRVFYEPVARQLEAGNGFHLPSGSPALKYPPGIPSVFAATFWLSDHLGVSHHNGLRALQGLLTVATSLMVAMIAFETSGARVGLMACFLWSTYPFHLWLSKQPSAEPLICVLLAASVLAFLRWTLTGRGAVLWGSLCGAVVACAALTKPFNIGLAAVFVALAWICDVPCTRRARALFSASVVLAFALSMLPWEVWASEQAGHCIPLCTNGTASLVDGLTFGVGRNKIQTLPALPSPVAALANDFAAHRRDFETNRKIIGLLLADIRKKPTAVASLFFVKAMQSWYENDSHHHERWAALIQLFYLPLLLLGAWLARRSDRQYKNFALIACGVGLYYWAMTTFVALAILRYMVPAISLLMVVAGNGLEVMAQAFGWRPVLAKQEVVGD